jgi:hypothetical protein
MNPIHNAKVPSPRAAGNLPKERSAPARAPNGFGNPEPRRSGGNACSRQGKA